jgi:hypothetical protein
MYTVHASFDVLHPPPQYLCVWVVSSSVRQGHFETRLGRLVRGAKRYFMQRV